MKNDLSKLVKAAYVEPAVGMDLERRVMLQVARHAIERSRRRAKLALVASLSGLAMLFAACIAVLVAWFPGNVPLLDGGMLWLDGLGETAQGAAESMPFLKQWGGVMMLTLFGGGAVGFIYYLNSLFSSSYPSE